jgi:hypothetical protein
MGPQDPPHPQYAATGAGFYDPNAPGYPPVPPPQPVQPTYYASGDPYTENPYYNQPASSVPPFGYDAPPQGVAVGQPMMGPAVIQPAATPMGLMIGEHIDYIIIERKSMLLIVFVVIGCILTLLSLLSVIVWWYTYDIIPLLGFGIGTMILAFLCQDRRVEFDRGNHEFRTVHQRLLYAPCRRLSIDAACPFSSLGEPYMEVGIANASFHPGAGLCSMYLPADCLYDGRVRLVSAHLTNQADQYAMVEGWRTYVAGLRQQ